MHLLTSLQPILCLTYISIIILSECRTQGKDKRPIPLPHPIGLSDYTHTLLPDIYRTIYLPANGVHQAL